MRRKPWPALIPFLALLLAGCERAETPAPDAAPDAKPGPTLVVETTYPGANANVVADTIAAPIEEQVNGVENMLYMTSRSTNDGGYTLTIAFKRGTDLKTAQVLVQNRVALAQAILPDVIGQTGVSVKRKSPRILLMASLSSPGGRFDTLYQSNYAQIQIKDELLRQAGVADVVLVGRRELSLRIWVDPEKLAARGLTLPDVLEALRQQNLKVPAVKKGKDKKAGGPLALIDLGGGRLGPEELAGLILKTDAQKRLVYLRDVARLELGGKEEGVGRYNGKPCVVLCVYPLPEVRLADVRDRVHQKVTALRKHLPEGLRLEVPFDFSTSLSDYLVLDVTLPDAASQERTLHVLERCAKILRGVGGVKDILSVSGAPLAPLSSRGCIVTRLTNDQRQASREEIRRRVEKECAGAVVRLRDLAGMDRGPLGTYPVDLAVYGPEPDQVRKLAGQLADHLRKSKKLRDVEVGREGLPQPQLSLDVDRSKLAEQRVDAKDLFATLQVYLGSYHVNDFNRFGRTWQVVVQADARFRERAEDIKRLQVRNDKGEMIPLSALLRVRDVHGPLVVQRFNRFPMTEVTGNLAGETTPAQARTLCEEWLRDLRRSAAYRLSWLGEPPAGK